MPILAAPLDFSKYEARNLRAHILGTAPAAPVTGQMYFNSGDNTLYWYDGTDWVSARSAAGGTSGPAGGDLTGTYPNPEIAPDVITDVEIAAANKDGAVDTPSLRTLGNGATQAMRGDTSLEQIPVNGSPDFGDYPLGRVGDPTEDTDAANKRYVDGLSQGLDTKQSVKAASTDELVLSGTQTVDGVDLVADDRVLVKDQASASENGIYLVASDAWVRADDMDDWDEFPSAYVFVEEGTINADSGWVCTADQSGTLDTTDALWTQFSGAGQTGAGDGLTKTGSTIDVGAGAGIQVNADSIQIADDGITNDMIGDGAIDLATADVTGVLPVENGGTGGIDAEDGRESLGAGGWYSSATHAAGAVLNVPQATHTLRSTRGLLVQVQDEATGAVEIADVVVSAGGDVAVTFGASVAANSKRVTIVG